VLSTAENAYPSLVPRLDNARDLTFKYKPKETPFIDSCDVISYAKVGRTLQGKRVLKRLCVFHFNLAVMRLIRIQ
jgi:hypothetical protein